MAPVTIWASRLLLLCLGLYYVAIAWRFRRFGLNEQQVYVISLAAVSLVAATASFIRAPLALRLLRMVLLIVPLNFAIALNSALVLAWWSWIILLPVELLVPAVLAYCLWKDTQVNDYFSARSNPR